MKSYRVLEIITTTKVILNCGSNNGIRLGTNFLIFGLSKPLFDPETNAELGPAEIVRGKGRVTHLQNNLCTVESVLTEQGTTKVIKRSSDSLFRIPGLASPEIEEISSTPRLKEFERIQVGDYAREE
jgi:hypothetical protein